MPASEGPQLWGDVNARLGKACAEVGRNPAEVRRFGQVPLHPAMDGQVDDQLALLPEFEQLGCEHRVLAFRQPPSLQLLERCAGLA